MNKKRTLALMLAILTLMTCAPALAQSQTDAQPQQNGTFGQVTQIDGNSVTLALASMGGPGGGQNGQAPQGNAPADANGQAPQGNAPTDANGKAQQGNPPSGGQAPSLTLTGETITFTVDDATQITLRGGRDAQNATGSLADIQVGTILMVTLNGNVATAISVQQTPAASAETTAPAGN